MNRVIILLACCFLAGSCSTLKPKSSGEFEEKYTITYETKGPKAPIQTLPAKEHCPRYSEIVLQKPSPPPDIDTACEADAECVSDALAGYIKELRVIMAKNREIVADINKQHQDCKSK